MNEHAGTAEKDAASKDADVLALMRLLAPVVEHRRHYGLNIEDAEVYARTVLDAGYRRVFPPGSGRDPLECPPDGGCGGCGNWPEHCVCTTAPGGGDADGGEGQAAGGFSCSCGASNPDDCEVERRMNP